MKLQALFVLSLIAVVSAQTFYASPSNWTSADTSGFSSVSIILQSGIYSQGVSFGNVPSWLFSAIGTVTMQGGWTLTKPMDVTVSGITFTASISSSLPVDLLVNSCKFINSTTGAISVAGNVMVSGSATQCQCNDNINQITGSTFSNNTNAPGASISLYGGTLSISSSSFTNHAHPSSAISLNSGAQMTITSSFFFNNSLGYNTNNGGVLSISSSSATISGCTFSNNIAGTGGSIYGTNSQLVISSSSFDGDSALFGGSIKLESCQVILTNSTFSNSNYHIYEGVLAVRSSGVVIQGCRFTSMISGGTVVISSASNVTMVDSTYTGNTASYGGAISNSASYLNVKNCTFNGNFAYNGGGIYLTSGSNTVITESSFSDDVANNLGGALFADETSSVSVSGSYFNANAANSGGSSIYAAAYASVSGCTFFGGKTITGEGGALYAGIASNLIVRDNRFFGCRAQLGGAISARTFVSQLTNNTFNGNRATNRDGGAVYLYKGGFSRGNTYVNNSATGVGGALCSVTNGITVTSDVYSNNSASLGGALYFNSTFSVFFCTFTYNGGITGGGAVYAVRDTSGSIYNSLFDGNANTFLFVGASVNLMQVTVTNSSPSLSTDASVLLMTASRVTMINPIVYANLQSGSESAVRIIQVDDGALTVVGGNFTNNQNQATSGVVSGAQVTMPDLAKTMTSSGLLGYVNILNCPLSVSSEQFFPAVAAITRYQGNESNIVVVHREYRFFAASVDRLQRHKLFDDSILWLL
ncbi:polymorphic outer membrane protein [Planoprotostelium fungivorum]|uniref:Polymorphic outer membrane protein n=1 Tax=Planoprotostelium fungivorum TaxID=1890364 RepID=A0A2P6NFM8_9EUKA|nr:polymorphic outer membrane protein [Planoprotostelium fungivorum]